MTSTNGPPPAGWYTDPWHVARWRWWDGQAWTGYTDRWYSATVGNPSTVPIEVDESRPIRAGWTALFGALGGVGLSIAFYVGMGLIGVERGSPWRALAAQLGLWTGLLGACWVAVDDHGTGSLRDLGFRVRWVDLALGLGFGFAALMGAGMIAQTLKSFGVHPQRYSLMEPLRHGPLTVVIIAFIGVIGAPFVEEMFFRGLLMSGLVARWGAVIGIISQAVLFGLVHLSRADARGNLGVFLLIAPLGAMLGILRFTFKRLGPGMFTHAIYNAVIITYALTR